MGFRGMGVIAESPGREKTSLAHPAHPGGRADGVPRQGTNAASLASVGGQLDDSGLVVLSGLTRLNSTQCLSPPNKKPRFRTF